MAIWIFLSLITRDYVVNGPCHIEFLVLGTGAGCIFHQTFAQSVSGQRRAMHDAWGSVVALKRVRSVSYIRLVCFEGFPFAPFAQCMPYPLQIGAGSPYSPVFSHCEGDFCSS